MLLKALLKASALLVSTSHAASTGQSRVCNNFAELCSRSYSEIAHLGAHDSAFVKDESTGFSASGNQYYDSIVQLDAGVRLLSAQVHSHQEQNGGPRTWNLCHSSCDLLDAGTLRDWLSNITAWMDRHPNDVVTILLVNADDASASDLAGEFTASGIDKYGYVPQDRTKALAKWPTLNDLIDQNKRMVSFVASLDPQENQVAPYLLDEFTFLFENPFEVTSPAGFSCDPERPEPVSAQVEAKTDRHFLMNHFLGQQVIGDIVVPNEERTGVTNSIQGGVGALGTSAAECTRMYGRIPTFVLVDYFNVGPAINAIDLLNNLNNKTPVGRRSLPTAQGQPPPLNGAASLPSWSWIAGVLPALAVVLSQSIGP